MSQTTTSLPAFGPDAPLVADRADLPCGVIALANEARFISSHYSEPLTQFSAGYRDPENLLAAVDYIAPPIPVGRRFEWKKADASQSFLTEMDDERAIGAGFKRVEYSGTTQLGKTVNRGLTYILDTDEDGGAVTEESIVAMLQQRILRNKYRRALAALAAITAGNSATFSSATQPDELIKTELANAQGASGVFPNRGLIGLAAWNLRSTAYAAQATAGGFAGLSKSAATVAGDLFLDDLRVERALYQSSPTSKTRLVSNNFYGVVAYDGLTKDDPSHLKQFYTPAAGGRYRVYRKITGPADKHVEITVEHYESIVATGTVGLARLNIS